MRNLVFQRTKLVQKAKSFQLSLIESPANLDSTDGFLINSWLYQYDLKNFGHWQYHTPRARCGGGGKHSKLCCGRPRNEGGKRRARFGNSASKACSWATVIGVDAAPGLNFRQRENYPWLIGIGQNRLGGDQKIR